MEEALNIGTKPIEIVWIPFCSKTLKILANNLDKNARRNSLEISNKLEHFQMLTNSGREGNSRGLLTCTCLSPAEMFRCPDKN